MLAVVPATENMPSGHALKPGDVVTQHNGKTVEIINTDAEGRLILADALSWCAEQGADRIVDLATLTGAVLTALGSTYAGLISNDDDWAERGSPRPASDGRAGVAPAAPRRVQGADARARSPTSSTPRRSARRARSTPASFLEEFVDAKPWVHLDIAGTAWDVGREYVGKGATGFGVRLLVALRASSPRLGDRAVRGPAAAARIRASAGIALDPHAAARDARKRDQAREGAPGWGSRATSGVATKWITSGSAADDRQVGRVEVAVLDGHVARGERRPAAATASR